MQKLISSISFLFIISPGFAQDLSYEILDQGNNSFSDAIIPVQNGYVSFNIIAATKIVLMPFGLGNAISKLGVEVKKLDKDLKPVLKAALFNGEKKLLPDEFDFFNFGKNTCMLYQDVKDNNIGNVKLLTIDESTLKVIQDNTVIDFAKNNIDYDLKKLARSNLLTYHYMISAGKKILMVYNEPDVNKDENKMYYVTLLDENLKVIGQRKINLKQVSDNVRAHSMIVDDYGNIYLAFKQFEDGESKGFVKTDGHKIGSYKNRLLIIKPDGKQIFSDIVKLEGQSTKGLGLVFSPKQNKTYILGSYSLGIDENHLGLFKSEIDISNMTISAVVKTPFPGEVLSALDKDGYANKDGKNIGLKAGYGPNFLLRGDGTVDVLMRYQYLKDVQRPDKTTSTFYEGSFVDAHFIDGKVLFATIPRDMESPSTNVYLGYFAYSTDEKLLLFYNESERNIERDISEKSILAIVQHTEVCAASIDKNGALKRQTALKGYESKSIAVLPNSFMVYPNSVFLFLQRLSFMNMSTRDTKFARVTIK